MSGPLGPGTCTVPRAAAHVLNRGAERQADLALPLTAVGRSGCGGEGDSLRVPQTCGCLGDRSLHLPELRFSSSMKWGSL